MTLEQARDLEFALSEEEALARATKFKRLDPFPNIPPALLSSADIEDYARVTAMLFPFSTNPEVLKPASYEVRPGRKFVWWRDDEDERVEEDIRADGTYELPPNSIRYMQIEPTIRLPDFIAIRFNLRIKHVHRGVLLGTGPLVDPGYAGNILIPLHNLTSEAYRIRGNEGLIWVEFTKTAATVKPAEPPYVRRGQLRPMEDHKADPSINSYFQRANEGKPIRSSIPEAVRDATVRAERAEKAAVSARNASRLFAGIGIVAIIALGVALFALFAQIYGNFYSTVALAGTVSTTADQAKADATRAITDSQVLRQELGTLRAEINGLHLEVGAWGREFERLKAVPPAPTSRTK